MIKAITFDLDGVYFTESGKKGFHKALVELVGDEDRVIHALYQSDEMRKFASGKMSESDYWDYFREHLSLDLSNQELRDLWIKEYKIDEDVRKVVLKAKENGYITCICSNNNIARVEALEERFGFLSDFDVKIFSYIVGHFKPSRKIFQALINEAGVAPNEIVYSDDNPERIEGARELGINVFVYESFEQFVEELEKLGVEI